MFQVTGTAATQNSRVSAEAAGAAAECRDARDHHGRERDPPRHVTVTVACMNGWIMQNTW
jgi:hypothetical protein